MRISTKTSHYGLEISHINETAPFFVKHLKYTSEVFDFFFWIKRKYIKFCQFPWSYKKSLVTLLLSKEKYDKYSYMITLVWLMLTWRRNVLIWIYIYILSRLINSIILDRSKIEILTNLSRWSISLIRRILSISFIIWLVVVVHNFSIILFTF